MRFEDFLFCCHARNYNTVESVERIDYLHRQELANGQSFSKELRGSDDGGVAVTLDRLEVGPVLRDDLRLPTPCTHCDQCVKRETLRNSGGQAF